MRTYSSGTEPVAETLMQASPERNEIGRDGNSSLARNLCLPDESIKSNDHIGIRHIGPWIFNVDERNRQVTALYSTIYKRLKPIVGQVVKGDRLERRANLFELLTCSEERMPHRQDRVAQSILGSIFNESFKTPRINLLNKIDDPISSSRKELPLLRGRQSSRKDNRGHRHASLRPGRPLALRYAERAVQPTAIVHGIRHFTSPVVGGAIVCGGMF